MGCITSFEINLYIYNPILLLVTCFKSNQFLNVKLFIIYLEHVNIWMNSKYSINHDVPKAVRDMIYSLVTADTLRQLRRKKKIWLEVKRMHLGNRNELFILYDVYSKESRYQLCDFVLSFLTLFIKHLKKVRIRIICRKAYLLTIIYLTKCASKKKQYHQYQKYLGTILTKKGWSRGIYVINCATFCFSFFPLNK